MSSYMGGLQVDKERESERKRSREIGRKRRKNTVHDREKLYLDYDVCRTRQLQLFIQQEEQQYG